MGAFGLKQVKERALRLILKSNCNGFITETTWHKPSLFYKMEMSE